MEEVEVNCIVFCGDGTQRTANFASPPSSPSKASAATISGNGANVLCAIEYTTAAYDRAELKKKLKKLDSQIALLKVYYGFDDPATGLKFPAHVYGVVFFESWRDLSGAFLQAELDNALKNLEFRDQISPVLFDLKDTSHLLVTGP